MIEIKHIDFPNTANYDETLDKLQEAEHMCRDKELHDDILNFIIKCMKNNNQAYQAEKEYRNQWKMLLGKYYKVRLYKKTEYGEYEKNQYIFPYDVIDTNNTLWLQTVDVSDDYNGGLHDGNIDFETIWHYDTTLEEITKEEFEKQAKLSVEHVIERRIKRERVRKNEYIE